MSTRAAADTIALVRGDATRCADPRGPYPGEKPDVSGTGLEGGGKEEQTPPHYTHTGDARDPQLEAA